ALNDTGMVSFTDGVSANLSLEPASHPGQDASFGLDIESTVNTDGHKGFSFTKFDQDGNPLPPNVDSWVCMQDNVTGLVWENKVYDVSLEGTLNPDTGQTTLPTISPTEFRAGNFVYGWRDNNRFSNGGDAGFLESGDAVLNPINPVSSTG